MSTEYREHTDKKIENNFSYHKSKDFQQVLYGAIRNQGKSLGYTINNLVPEGREKEIAMQKLEECTMWANAGIAREGDK